MLKMYNEKTWTASAYKVIKVSKLFFLGKWDILNCFNMNKEKHVLNFNLRKNMS